MKNIKVILLSLLALVFVVLSFLVDWLFLIPAVVIIFINQPELFGSKKKK